MTSFIGRKNELMTLENEYSRDGGFVVLYGRRRVGKTTLIKEFIKDKTALYFLATEEKENQNMRRFLNSLASFSGQEYLKNSSFHDWDALFQILANFKPNDKKVLIIDEFQYLVSVNPAFTSIFQNAWDEILKDKNVMVILCGSFISMMTTHTLSYGSPLYGRRTAQIRLQPLEFTELRKAFPTNTFTNQVEFYAVTGGVPKYFEFFDNEKTLYENIEMHIFNKSGFLYEEPLFLLEKEVREPLNYFSIIKTIAEGSHKLSEIATKLEQKSNSLSPYLNTLIDLFLIEKRVPITEKFPEKSRRGLYYIRDNFINFWFTYVYPFKGELEFGNQQIVFDKMEANFKSYFVSFIYEDICKNIFASLCREKVIDFTPTKIGSYWSGAGGVEIDVVAVDESHKTIFAGECKYYENKPVEIDVYSSLLEKCKNSDFDDYKIIYGLFSKTGFDRRLLELSNNNPNLVLINEDFVI